MVPTMSEFKNYTPGEVLYVFGSSAYLKMDATKNNGDPTINIEMNAAERAPNRKGVVADRSIAPINVQLDIFELVSVTAVLLGFSTRIDINRGAKRLEIERQIDKSGGVSCYVSGKTSTNRFDVPIPSSRIFFASMLCLSRLQILHGGTSPASLREILSCVMPSGNEIEPRKSLMTPDTHRDIPIISSNDPARRPPRPSASPR